MSGARQGSRLRLEQLEDRYLPATASAAYGLLALSFEANRGQAPAQVDYVARGSGYSISLTPTQALLALVQKQPPGSSTAPNTDVVTLQLVGANNSASGTALDKLPGVSNYIIGNDPSHWLLNIPTYSQVAFQNVYSGINVIYHGNQSLLEYDFVVSPGANPGTIRLAVSGAASMSLDSAGDLVLHTSGGDLVEQAPVVYQEVNGVRQSVAGRYVIKNDGQIGFAVGSYNASLPLTIDPVLSYSTYLGGSGIDQGNAIAVDSVGEAYITGSTDSTDFPTANAAQAHHAGGNSSTSDAFVAKFNAAGTALLFSTYLGGSGEDGGTGIAVDAAGNAFVTGNTLSSDFPTAGNPFERSRRSNRSQEVFVTELNSSGGLVYSTYLGGSGLDGATGIALDGSDNAYITGHTDSSDFPTLNAIQGKSPGEYAFVSKLNSTGSALLYSTYLGGAQPPPFTTIPLQQASAIAVDGAGDAYVTGYTYASDFPTAGTPFQSSASGAFPKVFVSKLNPAGNALVYSTFIGGHSGTTSGSVDSGIVTGEGGTGIAVDAAGDAYVTGFTFSSDFPTAGAPFQRTLEQTTLDGFVLKLNASGSGLIYSSFLNADPAGIALDNSGDAFVTGSAYLPVFPYVAALSTAVPSARTGFVTKVNPDGSALVYSTPLEGTDSGAGIAVDASDNVYVTGTTSQSTMPTLNAVQPAFHGQNDAFVAKLSPQSVTTVSPVQVYEGGGSFTLIVQGSGFTNGSTVNWNGTPQPTTFVSSTELQVTVPASFLAEENNNTVTVSIPNIGMTNPQTVYVVDPPGTFPPATLSTVFDNSQGHVTFAVDATNTLYSHVPATGWTKIAGNILTVSAGLDMTTDLPVAFAVTTDHGLLVDDSSGLRQIGGNGTIASVSAGLDAQKKANVYVVTTDGSLIEWQQSGGWRPAIGGAGTIATASALADDRVVAMTTDHSVYEYDPHFGWYPLAGPGFASSIGAVTGVDGRDEVFVQAMDRSLWQYYLNAWQMIGGAGSIVSMSVSLNGGGLGEVSAITATNQLAEYSPDGWNIAPGAPGVSVQAAAVPQYTYAIGVPVIGSGEKGSVIVTADGSLYESETVAAPGTFTTTFTPLTSPGFMDV
jgi:hypothetical protein